MIITSLLELDHPRLQAVWRIGITFNDSISSRGDPSPTCRKCYTELYLSGFRVIKRLEGDLHHEFEFKAIPILEISEEKRSRKAEKEKALKRVGGVELKENEYL
jgi:hypothetical protein